MSRRKNLALLAYLALANEPRRREELIALLWPELDAYHAQTALRRDLWVLKTALVESVLVATPHTVGLSASGGLWCDVNAFQQLLATALQTAHKPQVNEEEIAPLVSAVQLYRDDFLRGFSLRDSPPFDEWQVAQTEALRHQLTLALGALVAAYAQQAQPDLAITYAQRLVEIDPFHEAAHAQLMRLYAEGGRVGAALQQFESYARLLTENFDLPPSAEMSRLHAEIQARLGQGLQTIALHLNSGDVKALHTQGSSVPSVAELVTASTHHLPTPATPFVGRAQEVAQLMHLLAEPTCRLITVLGPGGVGKSRLAIETAVRRQRNYADGVYFVSLAALRHPQLLPAALLEALGVMRETDRTPEETLTASLQQRQLLLILDNFEHLLAATPVLLRLLADTTELQLLVTSRTRLNVPAEWLYALEGMSYPVAVEQTVTTVTHAADESLTSHDYALSPRYDAVDLFRQCAQRIAPSVSWSTVEEAAVVEVCRLVEGIPLAIELAAAWLPVMPVAAIVVQLQQGLDLLVTQQTAVVERHRSMHAALEYSWQLATPAEQIALAQLAVFHGGFLPSFAQAVADADPIMLRTLTDKSWLHRRATGRLELHELIRQFCAEKLMGSAFDLQRICTRHAQAYANFLQDRFVELRDWRQVDAVQAVVAELDNLRAAWAHAVAVRALELLHELVESIYRVGLIRNWHRELIELFQATVTTLTHTEPRAGVVAAQQQTPATEFFLARLHARLARYLVDLGQYEEAAIHADTALALLDRGGPELATKPAWLQERSLIFAVHSSVLNNVGPLPVALAKVQETYRLLARLPQGVDSSEILVLTTRVEGECRFAQGDQSAVIVQLSKLAAQLRNQGEMWLRSQILALLVYFLRGKMIRC
ncbi:MAG: BTAD domain-containing putative transcriptional regulator [Caldilineaceae bacterium]